MPNINELTPWEKQVIANALKDYANRMSTEAVIYRRQDNTIASDDCRKHATKAEELCQAFRG